MENDDQRGRDHEQSEQRDPYREAYGERYYQNRDELWPDETARGRGRSSQGDFLRGRDDEVERRRPEGHLASKKWPLPRDRDRTNDRYSRQMRGYEDDYRRSSGNLYFETSAISGPYSGRGPMGYRRSDPQIVEEACQRLERDGHIDATDIEVRASDGVIELEGSVSTRAEKRRAEACVESIYGVRDVMNRLRVTNAQSSS
jgi:hypothetical protein